MFCVCAPFCLGENLGEIMGISVFSSVSVLS